MNGNKIIVEAKKSFVKKIDRRLSKHGRKIRACAEIGISRKALWQFLRGETIRKNTLEAIVREFEGESADIEDFIKKL